MPLSRCLLILALAARGVPVHAEMLSGDALVELDHATRRLESDPGRRAEAAEAHATMAVAYLSLGNEASAAARYRKALALDPGVRRRPGIPASTRARLEALARAAESAPANGGGSSEGGSKIGWILGGVGVAAAAVAIVVSRGGGLSDPPPAPTAGPTPSVTPTPVSPASNRAPTVSIREVQPVGQGIPRVTRFSFAADAADPDGDSVRVAWDFGDGTSPADGLGVAHVFNREGNFEVRATATDGKGGSASATRTLTARLLSGSWNRGAVYSVTIVQDASSIRGSGTLSFEGNLSDPYGISVSIRRTGCATSATWSGTVGPGLNDITLSGSPLCGLGSVTFAR